MQKQKYNKPLYLVKILSLTCMIAISQVMASQEELDINDFTTVSTIVAVTSNGDEESFYPTEFTHAQVQSLKTGFIHHNNISITADDPSALNNIMISNLRFVTNWWRSEQLATRVKIDIVQHEDAQISKATYKFGNGTEFVVTRCRKSSDPVVVFEDNTVFKEKAVDAALHAVSFVTKTLMKKNSLNATEVHPQIEAAVQTLGYPTITHMIKDAVLKGKDFGPSLIKKLDVDTEVNNKAAPINAQTDAEKVPVVYPGLHALSNGIGLAVSKLPVLPAIRDGLTMYAKRQGFPTVTHYICNHKEMTDEQVAELVNDQTKLAEGIVAAFVKATVPYGDAVVFASQTSAQTFLNESSMTAYIMKKISTGINSVPAAVNDKTEQPSLTTSSVPTTEEVQSLTV